MVANPSTFREQQKWSSNLNNGVGQSDRLDFVATMLYGTKPHNLPCRWNYCQHQKPNTACKQITHAAEKTNSVHWEATEIPETQKPGAPNSKRWLCCPLYV